MTGRRGFHNRRMNAKTPSASGIAPAVPPCHSGGMRHAETVTFGGGDIARAAHLRREAAIRATRPEARVLLLWRGKPCLDGDALLRVAGDHPVLADAGPDRIFLGIVDGVETFAAELRHWTPEGIEGTTLNAFADRSVQVHPALPDGHGFAELRTVMTRLSRADAELAATAKALFDWHRSHRFCARCGSESAWAEGGWQRTCPACGGHHFPRTDPVVIMLVTLGNDVLLGRSPGWPEGMYSLLAGFVEPGETLEAAVRREVAEETGIACGAVDYLSSQPWPFPTSLMFGCRTEALNRDITLDPKELEDALWVSRERLAEIFAGRDPDILPARQGAIAHFLLENWLADRLD